MTIEAPELDGFRSKAIWICPDMRLTRIGPFKKSPWRDYADRYLLHQPDMEWGFGIENYGSWIVWAYEMLAKNNEDNPIVHRVRDLRSESDDDFKVPWLISFRKKGFSFEGRRKSIDSGTVILTQFKYGRSNIERELLPDRFGIQVIVERRYQRDQLGILDGVATITQNSSGGIIMRLDDTRRWGYQQWADNFLVGNTSAHSIVGLNRIPVALPEYLLKSRFVKKVLE